MLSHHPLGRGADFLRAWYLGRGLAQRGHLVTLSCSRTASDEDSGYWQEAARLQLVPAGMPWMTSFARFFSQFFDPPRRLSSIKGHQFDLVHTFGPRPSTQCPAWILSNRQGIPVVADWSDWWGFGGIASQRKLVGKLSIGLLDHAFERRALSTAKAVTVVSQWAYDRIVAMGRRPEVVLNLGVGASVDNIQPMDKRTARAGMGFSSEDYVVGYSGLSAFDEPLLSQTLSRLAQANPRIRFLLIGQAKAAWDARPEAGVFLPQAICVDHVPHYRLASYLACADLMLLPLPSQPLHRVRMPLRLGDYMAAGRPVVTCGEGDAANLVREERVGTVAPAQAGALADSVEELLANQPKLVAMGERARSLAEEKYSWTQQSARLEQLYLKLL